MLSQARILATALFICESEANAPFCFALKVKGKVGASEVKLKVFLASTLLSYLLLALSRIFWRKEHLKRTRTKY
jgi:hypothetical protein